MADLEQNQEERRAHRRYPFQSDVHFRLCRGLSTLDGYGRTMNMSSSGILFSSSQRLPRGTWVTLEVGWPVLLDHRKPIKLVTHGKVVRCEDSLIAVRIRNWDFKTCNSFSLLPNPSPQR